MSITNPVSEALGDFFDQIWHDTEGYVYLPVKEASGQFRKFFVQWPEKRQAVVAHVLKWAANPDAEIFFSPALFRSMDPHQKNVLGSWVAWADFDGNAPVEWDDSVVPLPTIEVQSSTEKKRHVYWALDEFVTDAKRLEKINRSIAYALDADTSGWDSNQFLRPPFSVNRKYDKPITAKVVADRLENVYSLSAFADIPTPAEAIRADLELGDLPSIDEVKTLAVWDKEMLAIFNKSFAEMAGPNHDRSGALQRLAYFGAEKQWTDEQIMAVLVDADDRWKKYSTRPNRETILAELINRARAKHGYEATTFEGLLKGLQAKKETTEETVDEDESVFSISQLATMPGIDEWVVKDLLIPEGLGLVTGRPGVGKTQLSFQMAADLACGRTAFIDWEIEGGARRVLFLSLEMNWLQLSHMAKPLRERYPEEILDDNLFVHAKGNPLPLDQDAGQAYFLQLLDRYTPDVVFIDSLSLAASGDLSNDSDMKKMFDFLKVARNVYGFSLVVVHHHRKKANDAASKKTPNSQSDIYGSYIITASIDFALDLEEFGSDHENGELTMSWLKNRYAAPIQAFKVARSPKLHFSRNEITFDGSSLLGGGDE